MGKILRIFLVVVVITFYLSACTNEDSIAASNEISNEQFSLKIEELDKKIVTLQEEIITLTDKIKKPTIINPIDYDGDNLYVNSKMPLAIKLPKSINLPIVVYESEASMVIYYEDKDVVQFIESYSIVPNIIVKDNNDNPEYYDKKAVVKVIDDNWSIIRNISIETSLDEQTQELIKKMLENIRFY